MDFSLLIPDARDDERKSVSKTLAKYGDVVLKFCAKSGISLKLLGNRELYREASPALRRLGVDVDLWPCPPAGLLVCEERKVYLRSRSPMTVSHEFAHAPDLALGGGVCRSSVDPAIREAYANARAFVTPYAATGCDEFWAENVRAFLGVNDPNSCWPRLSRGRLKRIDWTMHDIIADVFAQFAPTGEQLPLLH
jgi:hypothetical protein